LAGFFTEALTQALRRRDGEKEVKEWERLVTEKLLSAIAKTFYLF